MHKYWQKTISLYTSIVSAMNFLRSNLPHILDTRLDPVGDPFCYLLSIPHGMVLLRLDCRHIRGNIVDHAITGDFSKRTVHDCAAETETQLSKESFE